MAVEDPVARAARHIQALAGQFGPIPDDRRSEIWKQIEDLVLNGDPQSAVNHPPHYARLKPEPIDVIASWGLDFCLGNVVKYLARFEHKADGVEDLKKARFYLDYRIARLESR